MVSVSRRFYVSCCRPHHVWGAGLELYETGAPDLGTASAGRAAMASDASTAASNPAGMTLLDRTQLLGAAGALLPSTNFDVASQTNDAWGWRWRECRCIHASRVVLFCLQTFRSDSESVWLLIQTMASALTSVRSG